MGLRWANIAGTVSGYIRLGLTGVRLKNSSGSLSVRNAGDSADAVILPQSLGTGTRNGTKFLRDDGTWQAAGGVTLTRANTTSTQASSSTTVANVTQLVLAVAANSTYEVFAAVTYQTAATTTGITLGFSSPASSTNQIEINLSNTSTTTAAGVQRRFPSGTDTISGAATSTAVTAATSNHTALIRGFITTAGTSGNFQLTFATEVAASAVTIQVGSSLILRKVA